MKKNYRKLSLIIIFLITLVILIALYLGNKTEDDFIVDREEIVFQENTYFAVENLGYNLNMEVEDKLFVALPGDEYYYIIPRYDDMSVKVYELDFDENKKLIYQSQAAEEFVVKGNESDIFSNILIEFTTSEGEIITFSPFISLKDGSLEIGEYGVEVINIF